MTRAEILNCLTDRPCDVCKFHESGRCERWDCVFEEKPDDAEPCKVGCWIHTDECDEEWQYRCSICNMPSRSNAHRYCSNCGSYMYGIKPYDAEDCEDEGMTREEAIGIMKVIIHMLEEKYDTDRVEDAVDMAIKALSAESCEDCISRQAVLNGIDNYIEKAQSTGAKDDFISFEELVVKALPSVTPKQRWIPVSERLPEPFSYVNCTCHSLIDDREDWVVETSYLPQPPNSPYSDWGNIPMLNWGECEVIAWMYRDIPEPYMEESEVSE